MESPNVEDTVQMEFINEYISEEIRQLALPNWNLVSEKITFIITKFIAMGTFGEVYQARILETNEVVALKVVKLVNKYKCREPDIMMKLDHCNIIKLKHIFGTREFGSDDLRLNMIIEYMPKTLLDVIKHFGLIRRKIPGMLVKVYMYQLFRSLAYIHSFNICHCDIKPPNLLVDPATSVLKVCDFGSAKLLRPGEKHESYICSRYYRAPELILGATNYTTKVDMWSAGCVMAELLLGRPIFTGLSKDDQLFQIMKILGTPTLEQLTKMNVNHQFIKIPVIKSCRWGWVFSSHVHPEAIHLVAKVLEYDPSSRISPLEACAHSFFNKLREPKIRLPNGRKLPPLFNFSEWELSIQPSLNSLLMPKEAAEDVAGPSIAEPCAADASGPEPYRVNSPTAGPSYAEPCAAYASGPEPPRVNHPIAGPSYAEPCAAYASGPEPPRVNHPIAGPSIAEPFPAYAAVPEPPRVNPPTAGPSTAEPCAAYVAVPDQFIVNPPTAKPFVVYATVPMPPRVNPPIAGPYAAEPYALYAALPEPFIVNPPTICPSIAVPFIVYAPVPEPPRVNHPIAGPSIAGPSIAEPFPAYAAVPGPYILNPPTAGPSTADDVNNVP